MKTNLLGCAVKAKLTSTETESIATIRGIYRKSGYTMTILADADGKFYDGIPVQKLTLIQDERQWSVVLYWDINHKIHAIKALRGATNPPMGLREAKDFVESHPNCVPVKDHLTHDEALELSRQISRDNHLECDVRRMI